MPVSVTFRRSNRQSVSRNLISRRYYPPFRLPARHVKAAQGGQRGKRTPLCGVVRNRDEGRDPLVLQDLLKANILVAEQELVDMRRHNGLRLWAQAPEHVDDRIGERRRRWTGTAVDHGGAAPARSGQQFFNLRNGGDAARTSLLVAGLLDHVDHKNGSGLRLKCDTLELGR